MDTERFTDLLALTEKVLRADNWKDGLNDLAAQLRPIFIFDNLALYATDLDEGLEEGVVFARAIGRERAAQADASWGQGLAARVIASDSILTQNPPPGSGDKKRIHQPYLLGLPLRAGADIGGALVFVRFGGPPYQEDQVQLARLAAMLVEVLLQRRASQKHIARLEDAQHQLQLQEDFIATVSHELRTPLGFIKGYSTTLLRPDTHWDETTQQEFLHIIDDEADRLTVLIDNLLASARMQNGLAHLHLQPVRLDALLRDVATRQRAHARDLEVEIHLACSPLILGDAIRLTQVFDNLFRNALKYARGAKISIGLTCTDESSIRVTFSDTGPGIAAQHLPYLFDRFYRVPGQDGASGTGLGLYISRQIILAHHGRIWAESTPGSGTTFLIELPAGLQGESHEGRTRHEQEDPDRG